MNLTLYLSPETEARLNEQARLSGRSPEQLALDALQEKLANDAEPGTTLAPGARRDAFREWLASMPGGDPSADLSRESIYGNRGE